MTWVALTEEQRMLSSTTARMVAANTPISGHASGTGGDTRLVEQGQARLWELLVSNGLVGLVIPERGDGAGGTTVDAALVVEQLARGLAPVPYLGTVLALGLLLTARPEGSEVAALLSGRPGCIVLESSLIELSSSGIAVDVWPDALAVGLEDDEVSCATLGTRLDSVDLSRQLVRAEQAGDRCGSVSSESLLRWRALALALVCADLVGTCAATLEGAVAHACVREQFGHPVGSNQAVQQLCADRLVMVEGGRSIMWHAAWAVDELLPAQALTIARVAKAYCAEMARGVCEAAIQVWGGLGMTWECPAHRYLRRALLDRQLFGDERVHLASIAESRLSYRPVRERDLQEYRP